MMLLGIPGALAVEKERELKLMSPILSLDLNLWLSSAKIYSCMYFSSLRWICSRRTSFLLASITQQISQRSLL